MGQSVLIQEIVTIWLWMGLFDLVQGFYMRGLVSCCKIEKALGCRSVCMQWIVFKQVIAGDVLGKLKLT